MERLECFDRRGNLSEYRQDRSPVSWYLLSEILFFRAVQIHRVSISNSRPIRAAHASVRSQICGVLVDPDQRYATSKSRCKAISLLVKLIH
jgi:hypothetical protein